MGKKSSSKKEIKQSMSARFTTPSKKIKKRNKKENSEITYQRRRTYYSDPARGGQGVCIKPHRMMRVMRAARAGLPEEFRALLTHSKDGTQRFAGSFKRVAIGGMDALANRTMEIAAIVCKARTGAKDDKGLPLRRSDMTAAIKVVKKMAH